MIFNKEVENKLKELSALISEESFICNSIGVEIKTKFFTLQFIQPERYDKRISCILNFENGFTLFFNDLEKSINSKNYLMVSGDFENDDSFNSYYIDRILSFFSTNKNVACELPPAWFLNAVKVSSERLARNFPDLAIKHSKEGEALWAAWSRTLSLQ